MSGYEPEVLDSLEPSAAEQEYDLPSPAQVQVIHDPSAAERPRRTNIGPVATRLGAAVLDSRRILLVDFI